jgi:hypothetical protein
MRIEADKGFGFRECPSCATEVPANSNRCPICGYEFPHLSGRQRGLRVGGGLLMLGLFVYLAFRLGRWIW